MDWSIFDGNLFDAAHKVVGDWIVQVRGQQIRIQVTVDGNSNYFYRNSHWFKNRQSKRPQALSRGFDSMEQALAYAVRELRAPFLTGNYSGEWVRTSRK